MSSSIVIITVRPDPRADARSGFLLSILLGVGLVFAIARGMGMGLSICKSIIESHNGRIWVSAAVPKGSVFHFELPLQQGGKNKPDLSDPTLAAHSGGPAPTASAPSLADEEIE